MSQPFTVVRARLGAYALHAKYSREEIAAMGAQGRKNARTKLEQQVIEDYHLDPAAHDFADRLRYGIKAHYQLLQLKSAKTRASKKAAR